MNHKLLKKLSRKELLEILLNQSRRIEELESQLEKVNKELSERKHSLNNIGSLADASLVLCDMFKAADEVCKIHIRNVDEQLRLEDMKNKKILREINKKRLEEIDKECKKRLEDCERKISNLRV